MKIILFFSIVLSSTFITHDLSACTIYENKEQKAIEFKKVAMAGFDNVISAESSSDNITLEITRPTPMCPEEIAINGQVSLTYQQGSAVCSVTLTVRKLQSYVGPYNYSYIITGRDTINCQ